MIHYPKSIPICGVPASGFFEKPGTFLHLQTFTIRDNLPPVRENDSLFLFVTNGSGNIVINGVRFPLSAGSFLWLQSYHTFTIAADTENPLTLQLLVYDYPLSSFLAFRAPSPITTQAIMQILPLMQLSGEQETHIRSIFQEFASFNEAADPGSSLIKVSLLGQLAYFFVRTGILQAGHSHMKQFPLGWQAVLYLGFHFSENLTAASTAAELETTPAALNRELRLVSGHNFGFLLNQMRAAIAAGALLYENISLAYIAERSGFASEVAFYRIFKQHMGMTPLEFREKMLKDAGKTFRGMIMSQALMEVLNHFYNNFLDPLDLKDTSQDLYLSESVIRKLIQERFGATYKDFSYSSQVPQMLSAK